MAGKVFVKNTSGTGTTHGLRFNPRSGPEEMQEDKNLGRDDAEGKEKDDRRKRDERENRHDKIEDMKHVSIPVPGKKRPEGDNQRNDEELSELTGPVSSTGAPLDAATGAKTGTGSAMGGAPVNVMTGYKVDLGPDLITKKKGSSKIGRHGRTETVSGHATKERSKETARLRRGMGGSTEERYYTSKGLPRNNTKEPHLMTVRMNSNNRRTSNARGKKGYRQLGARRRQMKGRQSWQEDMRVRNSGIMRNRVARREGTGRYTKAHIGLMPTRATMAHSAVGTIPSSAYQVAKQMTPSPTRQPYQSGVARTTGGMDMGTHVATAPSGVVGGPGQEMLANKAVAKDMLADAEELLRKASISAGDLLELRQLIRELRRAIRSTKLAKGVGEDAEHDDERPTPNAHRTTTSNPTGATETDPDDDPRYWGAHPLGLLLPRRGHM